MRSKYHFHQPIFFISLSELTSGKPLINRPRPTTQTTGTIVMGLRSLGTLKQRRENIKKQYNKENLPSFYTRTRAAATKQHNCKQEDENNEF